VATNIESPWLESPGGTDSHRIGNGN